MLLNGMVKILKVNREGKTSTGQSYVHCSAISYDNNEQFIMIKAFGSEAEFIKRNLKGARRAFVSGSFKVETYTEDMEVTKSMTIGGVKKTAKFKVAVEKTSITIEAHSIQFIDKAKSDDEEIILTDEDEIEFIDEECEVTTDGEESEEMVIEVEEEKPAKPTRKAGKRK